MAKKTEAKELTIREGYELTNPQQMAEMATILKNHIVHHKLFTPIVGKNYVQVEGWQYAGGLLGLFPRVTKTEDLSTSDEVKWKAEVEVINFRTGVVVSTGVAICSNKENKKKSFDEYAILSMAQTRAIGKAYRNMLGWVMKTAGYESTPSEEMDQVVNGKAPTPAPSKEVNQDQVLGPDGEPTNICAHCGQPITEQEYTYSMRMFKKPLCREGQAEARRKHD